VLLVLNVFFFGYQVEPIAGKKGKGVDINTASH
jgi:hypothetical protein